MSPDDFAAASVEGRPYHASAADRLARYAVLPSFERTAAIEADGLAKALYWKRDRWLGEAQLDRCASDDDNRINHWTDVRDSGRDLHRAVIERLWATRATDRTLARMLALANTLPAASEAVLRQVRAL